MNINAPTADLLGWLPATKLQPVSVSANFLMRPRLLRTLCGAISHNRLTLVLAPTGYGKSTILSFWAQNQPSESGRIDAALKVAWLSLDHSENDRTHFLLALIASLRTLHPACGVRAQMFLTPSGRPEPIDPIVQMQIVAGLIIIDIQQYLPHPFALVLDNYEYITDSTVRAIVDYLVARLPSQAHIVIASSRVPPIPLVYLQSHGHATRIGISDLALDLCETDLYLQKLLGSPLPPTATAALHGYTEGWPTGLWLIAQDLKLLSSTERVEYIAALRTSLAKGLVHPRIDAFFRETLYAQFPLQLRFFMLQTSILSTLTAETCQAVSGRPDAAELLEKIRHRNLFLISQSNGDLDSPLFSSLIQGEGFRYHRLWAAFLGQRLRQEAAAEVTALHRRAAKVEKDWARRVMHYLAGEAWHEAARLILEVNGYTQQTSKEMLLSWILALPEPVQALYPELQTMVREHGLTTLGAAEIQRLNLTSRQIEILRLLEDEASNQDIAETLVLSLSTVKGHIGQIMRKLDVKTRREATERAIELGILS